MNSNTAEGDLHHIASSIASQSGEGLKSSRVVILNADNRRSILGVYEAEGVLLDDASDGGILARISRGNLAGYRKTHPLSRALLKTGPGEDDPSYIQDQE